MRAFLQAVCVWSVLSSCLYAQAQHPARAGLKSKGGAIRQRSPYLTGSFDIAQTNVGPHFLGNDIVLITQKIKTAAAVKEKSEFESSSEYQKRLASLGSHVLPGSLTADSYLAFVVDDESISFSTPQIEYDADAQVMSIKLTAKHESAFDLHAPNASEFYTVPVRSIETHRGSYVGTNSYGLSFVGRSPLFPNSDLLKLGLDFYGTLHMSPIDASALKPNTKVILVCKLAAPWYRHSAQSFDPTIETPVKALDSLDFIEVTPKQLWLVDVSTGAVIYKFTESAERGS